MYYVSTRDSSLRLTGAQAIVQGLSRDGGLLLPETIPQLAPDAIETLARLPYPARAAEVMAMYLDEFTAEELRGYAEKAYGPAKFDTPAVAPLVKVGERTHVLELWHGPTCAFKDMALQMLPYLLTASLRKTGETRTACILVATSGDTGKAALEGFRDVPHTKILVFYPKDGVSDVQKLQMVTQEGGNVGVCAVEGNFDDAQTGVKKIFSDPAVREAMNERGCFFSSANSINWGRVLPQIAYYVSAYCDLVASGQLASGQVVNVCVPTGNFGNILAAYYAKMMGVPFGKLICASNANNVLTDFIRTGVYDRNRPVYCTSSPSIFSSRQIWSGFCICSQARMRSCAAICGSSVTPGAMRYPPMCSRKFRRTLTAASAATTARKRPSAMCLPTGTICPIRTRRSRGTCCARGAHRAATTAPRSLFPLPARLSSARAFLTRWACTRTDRAYRSSGSLPR